MVGCRKKQIIRVKILGLLSLRNIVLLDFAVFNFVDDNLSSCYIYSVELGFPDFYGRTYVS